MGPALGILAFLWSTIGAIASLRREYLWVASVRSFTAPPAAFATG
ncbi:hypothetical protein [Thermoproteus tenax]|nr:hypothetical protein [Thermoproteus tenax]